MNLKFSYVLCVMLSVIFFSCDDCGTSSEPILYLDIDGGVEYERFYGIGGKDTLSMDNQNPELDMDYQLPVSIVSDTSIYLLFSTSSVDTLGITYERIIEYDNNECGYSIVLDNFSMLPVSSFVDARFSRSRDTNLFGYEEEYSYSVTLYK